MTKTCVVCKKYPVSGDNTRSFHKFPVNEDIKRLWMDITGISKLTVNCTVCSDHFTPQSYHKTDGVGTVKRLLRNAVPIVNKRDVRRVEEPDVDDIENVMFESTLSRQSQFRRVVRISASPIRETWQPYPFDSRVYVYHKQRSISNEHISSALDYFDDQSCLNDSVGNCTDEKMYTDQIGHKLKRNSTDNIRALNIKRMFRFQDGLETKYICREEFVTEEAWDKFLRLMLLNRRRMEWLRQRICGRKKIVDFGQRHKEFAKKEEECNPERFLEVVLKE